jgi:hypothetical protein
MSSGGKRTVQVPVLTPVGGEPGRAELVAVDVDAQEASLAGRYWAVGIARFLETGDTDSLDEFDEQQVGGYPLETDPDAIEEFDDRYGRFDFQEVYKS